jgi:hypothetical protein
MYLFAFNCFYVVGELHMPRPSYRATGQKQQHVTIIAEVDGSKYY